MIKKYVPLSTFDEKLQKMQISIENHESLYNQLLSKPSMEEILMNNELSLKAKFENLASQQSRHLKIILEGALKENDNLMWSKRKELLNRLEDKIDSLQSP